MANNNLVVFEEETAPIITEILEKNGLKDPDELAVEKELLGEIILRITEEIVSGQKEEKNIIPTLAKELNIPQSKAEIIFREIKEKLLSIARIADPQELAQVEIEETEVEEKMPFEQMPLNEPLEEVNIEDTPPVVEKPFTRPTKQVEIPKPNTETKKSGQTDTYREPLE